MNTHDGFGVIDTLSINAKEVKCLEMALYFLTEQLNKANDQFQDLHRYRLNYISHWMSWSLQKSPLRLDGLNSVTWDVMDLEDVKWLALALEIGITEEVIHAMAADDANYDRDMTGEDGDYHAFHDYYCAIARLKPALLLKLQNILAQRI